jgi:hypothetical protein
VLRTCTSCLKQLPLWDFDLSGRINTTCQACAAELATLEQSRLPLLADLAGVEAEISALRARKAFSREIEAHDQRRRALIVSLMKLDGRITELRSGRMLSPPRLIVDESPPIDTAFGNDTDDEDSGRIDDSV